MAEADCDRTPVAIVAGARPGIRLVVLSLNLRNPFAIRTYRRAGFADTGTLCDGGASGPQHVYELWL